MSEPTIRQWKTWADILFDAKIGGDDPRYDSELNAVVSGNTILPTMPPQKKILIPDITFDQYMMANMTKPPKSLGIPNQNIARPASIILSMSVEERREQRRYETARDVLAGFASNPAYRDCAPEDLGDVAYPSRSAVEWADALLAELDKPVAAKQEEPNV